MRCKLGAKGICYFMQWNSNNDYLSYCIYDILLRKGGATIGGGGGHDPLIFFEV